VNILLKPTTRENGERDEGQERTGREVLVWAKTWPLTQENKTTPNCQNHLPKVT